MAEPASLRLFAGISVPGPVAEDLDAALAEVRAAQPRLRWTRPAGWHLTLAFIGEVPAAQRQPAVAAVEVVASQLGPAIAPAEISLGRAGRFGRRVLWVGVDQQPDGWLTTVGARLQAALADTGVAVERREVAAHLTLARAGRDQVRHADVVAVDRVLDRIPPLHGRCWRASALTLWRSHLGAGPARYEVVVAAPLVA